MKYLKIRRCEDCPFIRNMVMVNTYCCLKGIYQHVEGGEAITNIKRIPRWCPLPDLEELQDE
jgi:hypothetical protein